MRWLFGGDREVELAYLSSIHKLLHEIKREQKLLRDDLDALRKKTARVHHAPPAPPFPFSPA